MKCSNCGRDVPYEASVCENCGEEMVHVARPSAADSPQRNAPAWMSDEPKKGLLFTALIGILFIFLAVYSLAFVYLETAEYDSDNIELASDLYRYSQLGMFIFATLSILSLGLEVFPFKR